MVIDRATDDAKQWRRCRPFRCRGSLPAWRGRRRGCVRVSRSSSARGRTGWTQQQYCTPVYSELACTPVCSGWLRCASKLRRREESNDRTDAVCLGPRPPVHRLDPGYGDRRPQAATGQNSVAGSGNGRRLVTRGPAGERQISGRLLGARLRLAALRVRAQSLPPIPDRDRRAGHSLHPRQVQKSPRDAADTHARLAGLDRRVSEADRPADRSGCVRRRRRRFIRRRRPVAPRVRVLPEAHGDRVDRLAHRQRVGGADEASRLHEVGRTRRRLGCRRHHRPRGHGT